MIPTCTTITAVLAVAPLHRSATCTSLVLSSYQAVSGAGHKAIAELLEQVEKLRGDEESLAAPDVGALPAGPVMGRTIAYNVVPLNWPLPPPPTMSCATPPIPASMLPWPAALPDAVAPVATEPCGPTPPGLPSKSGW